MTTPASVHPIGGRDYTVGSCPVLCWDPDPDLGRTPCGADMDILVSVHGDGAEYGVWVSAVLARPACGHSLRDIARAEQRALLGIEP